MAFVNLVVGMEGSSMLTPEVLRTTTLRRFTGSDRFPKVFGDVVSRACHRIGWEISNYGGGFEVTGFPGLSNQTFNKASRIWNYVMKDKKGRDKIRDEVDDLLNYCLYLVTYFNMLEEDYGKDSVEGPESSGEGHSPDNGTDEATPGSGDPLHT